MDQSKLNNSFCLFSYVSLGLNLLRLGSESEPILQSLEMLEEPYRSVANSIILGCAYSCSGNSQITQQFIRNITKIPKSQEEIQQQCLDIVSMAFVCLKNKTTRQMCMRLVHNMIHFCHRDV